MRKRLTFSAVSMVLLFIFIGQAADRPRFKVSIDITCLDANIERFVESHIKRELRALGDVDIVEYDPKTNDFGFFILAIAAGKPLEIVVIDVLLYDFFSDNEFQELMVMQDRPEDFRTAVNLYLLSRASPSLYIERINSLNNLCKEIILKFDIKKLEPLR